MKKKILPDGSHHSSQKTFRLFKMMNVNHSQFIILTGYSPTLFNSTNSAPLKDKDQLNRLKKELADEQEKVQQLTAQLSTNVSTTQKLHLLVVFFVIADDLQ